MKRTVGWILNLEADLELAEPESFVPSTRLAARAGEEGRRFLASAARGSSELHHFELGRSAGTPTICQSWCPTPRALAAARALGTPLPDAPSLDVLRTVNHRAFATALGIVLPGAVFVRSMPELDACLAGKSPRDGWLLKRPFGFAGRGRKRASGPLRDADRRWAEASMAQYGRGLLVEPFVEIEAEFALHGWLGRDGSCLRGDPTRTVCDAGGAWRATEADAQDLDPAENAALRAAHDLAARALTDAGYFGPFAIDAYRWRDRTNRHFQALGEINARYTMGFFAGLRGRQAEWIDRIRAEVG